MTEKEFKILSIDGGGIKGLYSATVLARIEERTGKRICDYFDMICGTSTGGLLALGLSIGLPAQQLADIYFEKGKEIFPISEKRAIRLVQRQFQFLKQMLFSSKFSADPLTQILQEIFGEREMKDAETLLCIPSYNLIKGMPRVFKFPHKEGNFEMDRHIKMIDVALATSAAPTYFPIHEIGETIYADGGLWANNPSLCGLLEALKYFVGEGPEKQFDSFNILSVSSVSQPTGWPSTNELSKSFRHWGNRLFQASMDGQSYFNNFFLEGIIDNIRPLGHYYRIPSPSLSKEQIGVIDMDIAHNKALKTLKSLGDSDGHKQAIDPRVQAFFNSPKFYKTH